MASETPGHLQSRVVPGRACGSCSLCCKVVGVEELDKPIGEWCPHCNRRNGCAIYQQRPESCRTFMCQWLLEPGLGPEWKPDRAKFALGKSAGGRHLTVFVDPGTPSAWRRSPYCETLKSWARLGAQNTGDLRLVDVMIGQRCIVVLPDRDVEVGVLSSDDVIQLKSNKTAMGEIIEVRKVSRQAAATHWG